MQDKPKSILTLLCLLALTSFMTGCASCREGFQELSRIDQEYRDGVMSALGTQMWLRNMKIEARNKELEDGPVISEDKMQVRNGLVYTVNQTEPFSGVVVGNYENGQKEWEQRYKDGKNDGRIIWWYESGQKQMEGAYKEGVECGNWTWWYANGQLHTEWLSKDDMQGGKLTWWYENGQKWREELYRSGDQEGRVNTWHPNGQRKTSETTGVHGQLDGKYTEWDENGQLKREAIYEDGELIEEKIY